MKQIITSLCFLRISIELIFTGKTWFFCTLTVAIFEKPAVLTLIKIFKVSFTDNEKVNLYKC